jgi:putative tryptophan/tyrosine transport system substrate-binding protein
MPVVGYLGPGSAVSDAFRVTAFRQGLSETGFVEGQNVRVEYRWAEEHYDRLPAMATDLWRPLIEGDEVGVELMPMESAQVGG